MPLVSVIMPSFNSADLITSAISSVQSQTEQNWELIISDDGSTDETVPIVQKIAERDHRVRLLSSGQNLGPAHARNAAINASTGRYIAFLDSDDLWKPEKLERQISFMVERGVAFTFSSYDRMDAGGNFINTHLVKKPVTYHDLLKSCVIGCLTAVYDSEKVGKVYMPDIRKRQDFGLWLRILKKVDSAVPLLESLAQYRVHSKSISANKFVAAKYTWSIYHDVEKLGLFRSSYYFVHYAVNGVFSSYINPKIARIMPRLTAMESR